MNNSQMDLGDMADKKVKKDVYLYMQADLESHECLREIEMVQWS